MSAEILGKIAREVAACTKCPLHKGRCKAVPGEGSPTARIMFIGEGPGYHEDQQGRPFVGPSGQLLDQLLTKIKIPREEVFITNVVKCRPPNNRDPEPAELEACKSYLDRQIAAINPRLIITLGRISMARYWPGKRISEVHGQYKEENGRMYMPMFHPSFALRDRFGPGMQKFKDDGLSIPGVLAKAEELARTQLWGFASASGETEEAAPAMQTLPLADTRPVPVIAEEKTEYPAKSAEIITKAPEPVAVTVIEPVETEAAPQQVEVHSNGLTNGIGPETAANLGSPVEEVPAVKPKRARKPKESAETEVAAATEKPARKPKEKEAAENGPVAVEKAAPKRKKKEIEPLAEQLTLF